MYVYTYTHTHTHKPQRGLKVYQLQTSKHMEVSVLLTMEVGSVSEEQNLFILGNNNA
jgi:hypothetical protein